MEAEGRFLLKGSKSLFIELLSDGLGCLQVEVFIGGA